MAEEAYYVLKEKAVPEVLLRVEKAKLLLESGKCQSASEAAEKAGISRSSFYKYKDEIFRYHENEKGRTVTMVVKLIDEPGRLSKILTSLADIGSNILSIHQSIPVNGIAAITLSMDLPKDMDAAEATERVEQINGVSYARILAEEQF
ncbi:MAG: ACT domain-containing protein [Lachnospiraceae bacterium]|uniref:ACT domain-containing protein n=1 Tax=Candidatus Weimeria bifida TaxID=2599074 RepID=A0A6N7J197_9FIRM|nr:ACT domain-containing protein [Candidatus Weimeria bifida]RRF96202.1 MAG: ACT domain-containing protein [Lachnospiraceae bacterium]